MTEEDVKGLLKEASEEIKEDFIPKMTNLLMDVFQFGINKGSELGVKVASEAANLKNQSSIKWQTGEPKESGLYLVTTYYGKVKVDEFCHYSVSGKEYGTFIKYADPVAWCKLSDIEPYKEETK